MNTKFNHLTWSIEDTFFQFKNRWVTFKGESCRDEAGNLLEYYSVNRADSIIIIPCYKEKIFLPQHYYRHGVKAVTLDFPGGRVDETLSLETNVQNILKSELKIDSTEIKEIQIFENSGWYVDSSFSSQKLYGATVHVTIDENKYFSSLVDIEDENIEKILESLLCLQCRMVFTEWIKTYKNRIK